VTFTLRLLLVLGFLISAPLFRGHSFYHSSQVSLASDSSAAVIFCDLTNNKKFERIIPDLLVFIQAGSSRFEVSFLSESPLYLSSPKVSSKFDLATLARAPPSFLLS